MPVIKRRSRFVTFRLLENEYEEFLVLCDREGARSLSDLARSALLRLKEHTDPNGLHVRLDTLTESVQQVDREVKSIARMVAGVRPAEMHEAKHDPAAVKGTTKIG